MLQVYDRVLPSSHEETLWVITGAVVFAMIIQAILDSIRNRLLFGLGTTFENSIQKQIYEISVIEAAQKKQRQSLNLWALSQSVKNFISSPWMGALLDLPWVPLYLIVIFLFHPVLGIFALIGASLMVVIAYINYTTTQQSTKDALTLNANAREYLEQSKQNAEAMLGLGMLPSAEKMWREKSNEINIHLSHGFVLSTSMTSFSKFFRMFIQVAMLSIGAYLVLKNEMSAGAIIANSIMLSRALAPIELISSGWKNMQEALVGLGTLLSLPPSDQLNKSRINSTFNPPDGSLVIDNLYYHADTPPRAIIKGISFQLDKADVLAIVGPSGSGKSTLIRLMLGIWEPTSGVSRFDGADIKIFGSDFFIKHIGYLPQQIQLFAGSISENIARLNEPDEGLVIKAAEMAGCHEMIMQLADGYNTKVGVNGNNLSMGQQQRIGLARAFYGNPTYIFLDEPNSNLDSEGDASLMHAIQAASKNGSTILLVAHRTSVLSNCNKILVLKSGQQLAFGPKEEVLKKIAQENKLQP
jgi:PrtD family type I secretion system ABC transporter